MTPPEPPPPGGRREEAVRADRDRFRPLGEKVGNPDRACLSCLIVAGVAILVFIGCLAFYYRNNAAFHQP